MQPEAPKRASVDKEQQLKAEIDAFAELLLDIYEFNQRQGALDETDSDSRI